MRRSEALSALAVILTLWAAAAPASTAAAPGPPPGETSPGRPATVNPATRPPASEPVGAQEGESSSTPPADAGVTRPPGIPLQLETALHVHTRATANGRLSAAEIAELARREGLDAVVYTDNLVRDTRYAPWPLRWILEARRTAPALVDFGVETFVEELEAARARFPDLLLIAGVEVTPYYWWSGSLLQGTLVLHDFQRDLIVVPGPGPPEETAELISGLPVIDNPGADRWGPGSLAEILPGLFLLLLGVRALHGGRPGGSGRKTGTGERAGTGRQAGSGRRRTGRPRRRLRSLLRGAMGVVALVTGAGLLIHHLPFTEPIYRPYDGDLRSVAEQRLIDHVRERDGLVLWSTPEVDNTGTTSVGPVRVRLESPPYVDGLTDTRGWNAFGGLYAHGIEAIEPGGLWDELLLEHTRGARPGTPWMVGESDFRYTGQAGKFLSEVLTVLLVPETSERAALEALGGGHSYVLRQTEDDGLRLAELTVSAVDGMMTAWPGQRLAAAEGAGLEVRVAVESRGGATLPCRVRLVRDGRVLEEWEATTPFTRRIVEPFDGTAGTTYYRLDVQGPRPHRLVTNPVLVDRTVAGGPPPSAASR